MGRYRNGEGRRCGAEPQARPLRTLADLTIVLLLVAVVVAICVHAPSHLYAYAQLKRASSAVSILRTGNWLLPINQTGGIESKPQLYPWLTAVGLRLTGIYDDLVFCWPTIAAAAATAAMVYLLALRWYTRRVALLAACLWAALLHMGRMAFLASTDMVLTAFITGAVFCADRLLFHPAPRRSRRRWAVGLWVCMILGALAKGWGVLNLALVGSALALAAVVGPGFRALRAVSPSDRNLLAVRLVLRRLGRAMKATYFGWGLLAMALVLVPLWIGMFAVGGKAFGDLIYFEFFQRVTGAGQHAPKPSSVPAVLHLLYYTLPASVFAVAALWLVPVGRWFTRRGPAWLPLCWVLAVVVPFSLTHGFRPDYLLPCYAAWAMLGAWSVEQVALDGRRASPSARFLRHVFAGVAVVACLGVAGFSAACMLDGRWMGRLAEKLAPPAVVAPQSRWALYALAPAGVLGAVLAVRWGRQWRIARLAGVAIAATLGAIFLHTHFVSRHARTGDGEAMRAFALEARPILGGEDYLVYRATKLSVQPYLGRLGVQAGSLEEINQAAPGWLVTCDRGLGELGACREDPNAGYEVRAAAGTATAPSERKVRLRTLPEELGAVRARSRPVLSQNWGRIYLIELKRPLRVSGTPVRSAWVSGRRDDEDDE